MYPHERSLVKRLDGKPFALIGINSDPELEQLKQTLVDESITWRSFWDQTTEGPIATEWNVSGWPTIYVLDHEGKIRFKNVREKQLDDAVDQLLREMGVEPPPAPPHEESDSGG